jgi:hypothetical protein
LYCFETSTLAEIEAAADALMPEQKQELLVFLAARLRAQRAGSPELSAPLANLTLAAPKTRLHSASVPKIPERS